MIASSATAFPPPKHSAQHVRRFWWIMAAVILAAFLIPAFAHAASLRVCILDNTSPDIATAPVYLNANPFHPDLLAGSTAEVKDGVSRRCNLLPLPATLAKGQNFTTTVTYVNQTGKESAPSNGVPFRNPGDPPVPVLDSVQLVVP